MEKVPATDLIKTLEALEPVFIKAGQHALDLQHKVQSYNKHDTGNPVADIVTEADFAVQELLLESMMDTSLRDCVLLAEEDTPSKERFSPQGKYYLGIDPIDDTAIYAKGGQHFSTIVSLHDGKDILYTFVYFPAWDWTHKVVSNKYIVSGKAPDFPVSEMARKTILYGSKNPENSLPKEVLLDLQRQGVHFGKISEVCPGVGSIAPFVTNKIAGVYRENMNAYDGLVEFSIASARGQRIYSGGPEGGIDLANIQKKESGLYYPGYYLALTDSGR